MTALLPCPFCWGIANIVMYRGEYWVECSACRSGGDLLRSRDAVVQKWNRRAPLAVDDAMVARALIAQRDALKIMPGRDSIDYHSAMRAALEVVIGGKQ